MKSVENRYPADLVLYFSYSVSNTNELLWKVQNSFEGKLDGDIPLTLLRSTVEKSLFVELSIYPLVN